jgi:hypothetical protein
MTHPEQPLPDSDGQPAVDLLPAPARPGPEQQVTTPPARRWSWRTVGIVVAVVVLVAAGLGTWFALNRSDSAGADSGSDSPQAAATKLLTDFGTNGLLGVVNDLPPTEATLVRTTIDGTTNQAGLLGVHTSGIAFDSGSVEQVNDHIAVAKLVAGTITTGAQAPVNGMVSILHTAFTDWIPAAGKSGSVNVAQLGHPIRIATVKVGGRWYPSAFYTIADAGLQALHQKWPTQSIAPLGADVPNEAVEDFMQAVVSPNIKLAIQHTSADDMAALHDAGPALVNATSGAKQSGVVIGPIEFDDQDIAGGGVDVVLKDMTVTAHGQHTLVTRNGDCFVVKTSGAQGQLCGISGKSQNNAAVKSLPPVLVTLLQDMVDAGSANDSAGMISIETRESWYVDLGRTFTQFTQNGSGSVDPLALTAVLGLTQAH